LIASWDGKELSLVIQPRQGFTKHMSTLAERGRQELALIDGPYGVTHDTSGFGTVIMIATGSGVIAFLSYIHELLREFESENAVTRRIELIWKVDRDGMYHDELRPFKSSSLSLSCLLWLQTSYYG